MQITQTNAEGLKREFKVTVGASDIDQRMQEKLKVLGQQIRLPGFRPGKAPIALLKRQYGKAVLGEVLEETVNNATDQAIKEHRLRPALQPRVEVTKFEEGSDLEYTIAMEIFPEFVPADFRKLQLERLVPEVGAEQVDAMLQRLADQQKTFEKIEEKRPATAGDAILIDFVGKVDGQAFDGGSAQDFNLELGSGAFIPGFEDQLVGVAAGDKREIAVTFPAEYANKDLAGKPATFEVDVRELRQPKAAVVDDEFAKRMGLESLDQLKDAIQKQVEQEYAGLSRNHLKRNLLDQLAAAHDFPVPAGMVELEFDQIWQQLQRDVAEAGAEMAQSGKTEDELKTDYRKIAERRVRLGLLLSEVGRQNNIEVKPEEVSRAMMEQARRFPGQERQVMEYFQKQPEAMAQLRAPIFEDKVINFITEMAEVTERKVSAAELQEAVDQADSVDTGEAPAQDQTKA